MDLTQFKTVEQLSAAIKTMISGTLSLIGLNVGSVGSAPASGEIKATSHIRTDGGIYAGNKAGSVGNDDIVADGDIYTVAWTDYSDTSTIVGWSSYTYKKVYVKKIGTLAFVQFLIVGTSNSTSTTFTVPYTKEAGSVTLRYPASCVDNGGSDVWGFGELYASAAIATFFPTASGGTWTASGTKKIKGQFFYEQA